MSTGTACRTYVNDTPIDATSTGTHTIETTIAPTGVDRRFHCMLADATIADVDNMLAGPVISIGTNNPDYDDIVAAQSVGGLLGIINALDISPDRQEIPEGTDIKCKVRTAALAVPLHSVTCSLKISLLGIEHLYSE